jgi:hypothetical protein
MKRLRFGFVWTVGLLALLGCSVPLQQTSSASVLPQPGEESGAPRSPASKTVAGQTPQVIQGPEVENFLLQAKIVGMKDIGKGVTLPRKATLELDGVTNFAVFKTIDEKPEHPVSPGGDLEPAFQDSWRTEVAAYELDKLVGFGLVPATVKRAYENQTGSLQLWVVSKMDEETRVKQKIQPPDRVAWENQVATLHLWDALIYNTDRQAGNLLITEDWKLRAIDHSRTFRPFAQLKDEKSLTRFSKSILEKLTTLTEPQLKSKLDPYLDPFQISAILKRRDAIEKLAKKLVAQKGEAAVLFE